MREGTVISKPNWSTPGERCRGNEGRIQMQRRRWDDYDPEKIKIWVLAVLLAVWASILHS